MYNELRRNAWVEINLGAIVDNFNELRALAPNSEIISCIKADAYGHGSVKVAWELIKSGTNYLGVATLSEAIDIRAAGIKTPIVLLSVTPRGNVKDIIDLEVIPVVTTYEDARLLSEALERFSPGKKRELFLALETGMGRLGILDDNRGLTEISLIKDLDNIIVKGAFSHFATAEEVDTSYALSQIEKFNEFCYKLGDLGIKVSTRTMANSAAIIAFPEAHYEIVRPGLALYGLYPSPEGRAKINLTPAMTVKALISYLKKVPQGFGVSYGKRFTTERESLLATISLGYADGLPRFASGKERVIVGGMYAPIVGNICMDQCVVDVTDIPNVKEYDEVVIMGTQGDCSISADEIADNSGTISYEVTCRFGQRLPKVFR